MFNAHAQISSWVYLDGWFPIKSTHHARLRKKFLNVGNFGSGIFIVVIAPLGLGRRGRRMHVM